MARNKTNKDENKDVTQERIHKALMLALQLEDLLDKTLQELRKASNLGIVDIMGGALIVSALKQSHMKKAAKYLREVKDVSKKLSRIFGKGTPLSFSELYLDEKTLCNITDIFVDNTISDFVTKARIEQAFKEVKEAYDANEVLIKKLEKM